MAPRKPKKVKAVHSASQAKHAPLPPKKEEFSVKKWCGELVAEGAQLLHKYASSYLRSLRTVAFPKRISNSMIVTRAPPPKVVRNPFFRIPTDILVDNLIPSLKIQDIAALLCTSSGMNELIEDGVKKIVKIYVGRHNGIEELQVGSSLHRTPYVPPQHASNLPILCHLLHFGPLMSLQRKIRYTDYINSVQCRDALGPGQFLDEHMRASVVDWMAEVSVEYSFAPSVLHCAVKLLDIVLSSIPVPRSRFQLLGCVCLYVRSRVLDYTPMTTFDVVYMCDNQYSVAEVLELVNFIEDMLVKDDFMSPTVLSYLAPLCSQMQLPLVMYQQLEIVMPIGSTPTAAEHVILAIFLSDLLLLDYQMLQYTPFTQACAVMFLARITLYYYGQNELMLTPFGIVGGKCREVKQLIRFCYIFSPSLHELYVLEARVDAFTSIETRNLLKNRLVVDGWSILFDIAQRKSQPYAKLLRDSDYFGHLFEPTKHVPNVLHYHPHMFAGIREKFAPRGSNREQIWAKLREVPRDLFVNFLDKTLPLDSHENT